MEEQSNSLKRRVAFLVLISAVGLLTSLFLIGSLQNAGAFGAFNGNSTSSQWTTVFTETFETGEITATWTISDESSLDNGEYYWATTTFTSSEGTTSVFPVSGGADGMSLTVGFDVYPNLINTSLQMLNPIDISEESQIQLNFDHWLSTEEEKDFIKIEASTNGSDFTSVFNASGKIAAWQSETVSLNQFVGEEQLWLKFVFTSDIDTGRPGVFIDNIAIQTRQDSPDGGTANNTQWTAVFAETFETGDITATWTISDESSLDNGEYYWATTTFTSSEGTTSVNPVSGGTDGVSLTIGFDAYPNWIDTSMQMINSVNISGENQIRLNFDHWLSTEEQRDFLKIEASTNGTDFVSVFSASGKIATWQSETVSLNQFVGEKQLWLKFVFTSDIDTGRPGVFIDNISIETRQDSFAYLPYLQEDPTLTPTNTPTPAPTFTPTPALEGEQYDFNGSIAGWEDRQRDLFESAESEVSNQDGAYLRVVVTEEDDFHIIAPLDDMPERPYRIDTRFRFASSDRRDKDEFMVVFAADWDEDEECPANDLSSCFNRYYMMRVRYRDASQCDSSIDKDALQVQSGRIDGRASNADLAYNIKKTICLDPDASGVDPNDWIELSIIVEEDDDLKFGVNGTFYDSDIDGEGLKFTDRTYQAQDQFGIFAREPGQRDNFIIDVDYFNIVQQ